MIKGILKIGLLLVAGLLVYNYFFGDAEEKATSQKVFNEIKDVGNAVKDFVIDERQRIKDGKYKKVLSKIKETLDQVEEKALGMDETTQRHYRKLRDKTERMENHLGDYDDDVSKLSNEERTAFEEKMEDLLRRTNKFLEEDLGEK